MNFSKSFSDFAIEYNNSGPNEQACKCPQCAGQRKKKNTRPLQCNKEKGLWFCHHCGWKGTLEKGSSYSDPAYNKPEYLKPRLLPKTNLPGPVAAMFLKRGISTKTLLRNKIGYGPVWMPQVEDKVNAISFPYFRNGEHINTKWRDSSKHFRLDTGCEKVLYGLDDLKDSSTVIWVEGEIDKLSIEEAGFKNCVSIPNGAPSIEAKNYQTHFSYLETCEKYLAGKKHILFVDSDDVGLKLEAELARRLGQGNCKRVRLPGKFKDANEYLVGHGSEALKEAVNAALPYPVSGIFSGNDLASRIQSLHHKGLEPGVPTGWQAVTHYFTVREGEMTVVTGIPNHGKSNWLDALLVNIAKNEGWFMGYFSPENQPTERHAASLIEKFHNKDFSKIDDESTAATIEWIDKHFAWILPNYDDGFSLDTILEKAKTLVYRYGMKVLVIDPWNEVEVVKPRDTSETEYISASLTKIRVFARTNKVHVFIVAHPAKLRKDNDSGDYPVPTPYDISGSAHWRNKADNCIAVQRNYHTNESFIHVQKIRFREVGQVGTGKLIYDETMCNYREASALDA